MSVTFADENGKTITQAEWVNKFAIPSLTKKQREVYMAMKDGYTLVSDQYTCKNWLKKDGCADIPVRNSVVYALYEKYMLEEFGELKSKTTDLHNHNRVYVQNWYRLIYGIGE